MLTTHHNRSPESLHDIHKSTIQRVVMMLNLTICNMAHPNLAQSGDKLTSNDFVGNQRELPKFFFEIYPGGATERGEGKMSLLLCAYLLHLVKSPLSVNFSTSIVNPSTGNVLYVKRPSTARYDQNNSCWETLSTIPYTSATSEKQPCMTVQYWGQYYLP